MRASPKWTPRKKTAFLKALRTSGIVTAAVDKVGLSRSQAYQLRKTDPVFRQAWDDAIQAALDELELELRRRAMHGVEQPVYYGGKECGRIRTYNDALGMFLLRTRRGEVYGEPAEDAAEDDEGPSPREQIEERLKRLAKRQEEGGDDGG